MNERNVMGERYLKKGRRYARGWPCSRAGRPTYRSSGRLASLLCCGVGCARSVDGKTERHKWHHFYVANKWSWRQILLLHENPLATMEAPVLIDTW